MATEMELRPFGFTPHEGPSYTAIFYNSSKMPVAKENWRMEKQAWQEWPAYDNAVDDEDYVLSRALVDLKVALDLADEIEPEN